MKLWSNIIVLQVYVTKNYDSLCHFFKKGQTLHALTGAGGSRSSKSSTWNAVPMLNSLKSVTIRASLKAVPIIYSLKSVTIWGSLKAVPIIYSLKDVLTLNSLKTHGTQSIVP